MTRADLVTSLELRQDGRRFVIAGLSRVAVRVAEALAELGGQVTVTYREDPAGLAPLLPPSVERHQHGGQLQSELEHLRVGEAEVFLALADDDLENFEAAVGASVVAPNLPLVLSAVDTSVADLMETHLKARRAYSPASLAAAAFVAGAMGGEAIETMRLGGIQVPICRLHVGPESPIAGKTAADLKTEFGCALVGHQGEGDTWHPAEGDRHRIGPGEEIVLGGPVLNVLRAARANHKSKKAGGPARPVARRQRKRPAGLGFSSTLLPVAVIGTAALLLITALVFAIALDLGPVDALFSAVSTAFGSPNLPESKSWLKVFAVGSMIAGGALVGALFAYLAALATAERLEQRMGRRAGKLRNHVVVAGLGSVGYEVERHLYELGVSSAVIERAPDHRYSTAVGERSPVLTGDVRLAESLERAGIASASCLIAVTTDDVVNIQACLQARRLNPEIRTVARVFDRALEERAAGALGIDLVISTSKIAARAFVGAAIDERSVRRFAIGGQRYLALRHTLTAGVSADRIAAWREQGLRVLAYRQADKVVRSPASLLGSFEPGNRVVVAGPEPVVLAEILTAGGR
jgi:Trk K+ transport system NAD-binding subunit